MNASKNEFHFYCDSCIQAYFESWRGVSTATKYTICADGTLLIVLTVTLLMLFIDKIEPPK